jgi:hypothetical protein
MAMRGALTPPGWQAALSSRRLGLCGSAAVRHRCDPTNSQLPHVPVTRGRLKRHNWMWLFQNAITVLILALGFAVAILVSLAGFPRAIRPICLTVWALFSMGEAAVALGYWAESDRLNAVLAMLQLLPSLVFIIGIAFFEARVVRVLLVYSALWVGSPPILTSFWIHTFGSWVLHSGIAGLLCLYCIAPASCWHLSTSWQLNPFI